MSSKLVIEKLSGKNFEEFIKLMEVFANFEKLNPPDKQAKSRLKKDVLSKNPKYEAYLGKVGNKYVGYVIFFMTYASFIALPTLFLEDLFVLEEYRKKGIGQKMLDFCMKFAKERNCGRVDLNVLDWNVNAINFYKKNNFKFINWELYRLEKKQIMEYGKH